MFSREGDGELPIAARSEAIRTLEQGAVARPDRFGCRSR
jgi:hypothetical protein